MVIRALANVINFNAVKFLSACRSVNKAKQTESIFFSGCRSGPLPGNVWRVGEGWGFGKLYIHRSRIAHLAPTRC